MVMMETGAGELGTPKVLAPLPPKAKTAKLTPFGYMPVTDGASVIPMPAQNWDYYDVYLSEMQGWSPVQEIDRGLFYWMYLGDLVGDLLDRDGTKFFTGLNAYMHDKPVMCMRIERNHFADGVRHYVLAHDLLRAVRSFESRPSESLVNEAISFWQSGRCDGVNCSGRDEHMFCKITAAENIRSQYPILHGGVFLSNNVMPFVSMSGAFKIVWAHCAPMTAEEKAENAIQAEEKAKLKAIQAENKAKRKAIQAENKAKRDAKKAEQQAKLNAKFAKAPKPKKLSLIYPDEKHRLIIKAIFKLEEEEKETDTQNITTTVNEIYGAEVVNALAVRVTMKTQKHKTCLEDARAARARAAGAQDDLRD